MPQNKDERIADLRECLLARIKDGVSKLNDAGIVRLGGYFTSQEINDSGWNQLREFCDLTEIE